MTRRVAVLLVFLGGACVPPMPTVAPAVPLPPPVNPGPVAINVRPTVVRAHDGTWTEQQLQPQGDALRSGDRLSLWVKVDQRAFVYVLNRTSSGAPKVIYPSPGAPPVELAASPYETRIPPPGKSFKIDETRGAEQFMVLASRAPMDEAALLARAEGQPPPSIEPRTRPPRPPGPRPPRPVGPGKMPGPPPLSEERGAGEADDDPPTAQTTGPRLVVLTFRHDR